MVNDMKKKGVGWDLLNESEKIAVNKQMPNIIYDRNKNKYRFLYSNDFKCWVITNVLSVPMTTKSMKGIFYE